MARIVVADDSWLTRKILVRVLESQGHDIVQATTGREALELIESHNAECMVLDLLMPEMDGLEVLEHLATSNSAVAVIVHTADIQMTTKDRCLGLGACAFLNKPVDESSIEAAVRQALCKRAGATE